MSDINPKQPASLRMVAPHLLDAMVRCAETRSIPILSSFLNELKPYIDVEDDPHTQNLYASLKEFARVGNEIERRYGRDVLLDLKHPDIRHSVQIGIIPEIDVARIHQLREAAPDQILSIRFIVPASHIPSVQSSVSVFSGSFRSVYRADSVERARAYVDRWLEEASQYSSVSRSALAPDRRVQCVTNLDGEISCADDIEYVTSGSLLENKFQHECVRNDTQLPRKYRVE